MNQGKKHQNHMKLYINAYQQFLGFRFVVAVYKLMSIALKYLLNVILLIVIKYPNKYDKIQWLRAKFNKLQNTLKLNNCIGNIYSKTKTKKQRPLLYQACGQQTLRFTPPAALQSLQMTEREHIFTTIIFVFSHIFCVIIMRANSLFNNINQTDKNYDLN